MTMQMWVTNAVNLLHGIINFVVKVVAKLAGLFCCYLAIKAYFPTGFDLLTNPAGHPFIAEAAEMGTICVISGFMFLAVGIFLIFKKMPDIS